MPTFVSPTGHPEVWDNKPIGYDTPEEWVQKIPVAVPAPTTEQLYASLRSTRDARLAATDKYMLADYPISEDNLVLVKEYRTALRDLPEQPDAPWDGGGEATPWPIMPEV